jgi:hypothetical protein
MWTGCHVLWIRDEREEADKVGFCFLLERLMEDGGFRNGGRTRYKPT